MKQVADAAGLDADAFRWVVEKISGRTVQALRPYDSVGARYVDEIEKLTSFVDKYEVQVPVNETATGS